MSKKKINENIFGAAKKFTDAFFDGLKKNTADAIINKAEDARVDSNVIKKLKALKKEKEELDAILKKYSK